MEIIQTLCITVQINTINFINKILTTPNHSQIHLLDTNEMFPPRESKQKEISKFGWSYYIRVSCLWSWAPTQQMIPSLTFCSCFYDGTEAATCVPTNQHAAGV